MTLPLQAGSEGGYISLFTLQENSIYAENILEALQCECLLLQLLFTNNFSFVMDYFFIESEIKIMLLEVYSFRSLK